MAYNEFVCKSGGNNMNGGHIAANTEPPTTPHFSSTNGAWVVATGVFTPVSGNPVAAGVAINDYAHVFADGSTTPTRIARVTAVSTTTITLSFSGGGAGTAPGNAASGISINVGGAWAGPSGAVGFPINFLTGFCTDTTGNKPRLNLKNDQTYNLTASITIGIATGILAYQGYTSTFGDGGKATIDGGTSGAAYTLWANTGVTALMIDLIWQNNGATGVGDLVASSTAGSASIMAYRCVFAHSRGNGLASGGGTANAVIECEAYDCNQSNTSVNAGFVANLGTAYIRTISHDNVGGANAHGFISNVANCSYNYCIADSNGGDGFRCQVRCSVVNCDAYNNTGSGYVDTATGGSATQYVENCNFVKNGAWGMSLALSGVDVYLVKNCGFGSGTMANVSGTINFSSANDIGEFLNLVTYAADVTPWVDPANGDFRISLSAAKAAGAGAFYQAAPSYAGTVGYPDIGSAQHLETGGGGGQRVIGG